MVHLYAVDAAMKIRRDNTTFVAIVNPYYMHDSHLVEGSKPRETATDYLVRVMLANKRKNDLLLPFFSSKYTSARHLCLLQHFFNR